MTKDDLKFLEDLVSSYIDLRRNVEIDNANIVSEEYYARTEKEIDAEHVRALGILIKIESLIGRNERLHEQLNAASWLIDPDRSGGQFTQDEIDNANRW